VGGYLTTSYFLRAISLITFEKIPVMWNGLKNKTIVYSKLLSTYSIRRTKANIEEAY